MALSFGLDDAVLADFPESQVRLVLADGVRNDGSWPLTDRLIDELTADLAAGRWQPHDESQPTIASWHEAYRRFGTNPRRTRPSVDALSRRLAKVGRLPRVNPVVDAYNLVSVRHGIPAGAFDVASIDEPVVVRPAQPGDGFTPLNETDRREEPAPGEVVYTAGSEVLTRHWNHRDCDRCKGYARHPTGRLHPGAGQRVGGPRRGHDRRAGPACGTGQPTRGTDHRAGPLRRPTPDGDRLGVSCPGRPAPDSSALRHRPAEEGRHREDQQPLRCEQEAFRRRLIGMETFAGGTLLKMRSSKTYRTYCGVRNPSTASRTLLPKKPRSETLHEGSRWLLRRKAV